MDFRSCFRDYVPRHQENVYRGKYLTEDILPEISPEGKNIMKRTNRSIFPFLLSLLLIFSFWYYLTGIAGAVNSPLLSEKVDLRNRNWTEAFKLAHEKLSREYPFTEWKAIDWDSLNETFLPRIEQASAAGNGKDYYLALHEYLFSIPDGHISLEAGDPDIPGSISFELAGGGYGLVLAELDDFRVIAASILDGCQAEQACIEPGAEIITWDGLPVRKALDNVNVGAIPYRTLTGESPSGIDSPKATGEHYRLEQARLLVRAPVGKRVSVMFKNPGSDNLQTAFLTAADDGGASFSLLDFASRPDLSERVDYWLLPEGYGYLLLRAEVDLNDITAYPAGIFEKVREAIRFFIDSKVNGMILDLRGNYGGLDEMTADLCGFFYPEEGFYEYQEIYDRNEGSFLRIGEVGITPQTPQFEQPVVVLVNPATKSSGEGLAKYISRSPRGHSVGFHGTNGSFGLAGGEILMPLGLKIRYPLGRSLDSEGRIQLDSRNRIGGVSPVHRIPKTLDNVLAFAEGIDVELEYAVNYLRWIGNW